MLYLSYVNNFLIKHSCPHGSRTKPHLVSTLFNVLWYYPSNYVYFIIRLVTFDKIRSYIKYGLAINEVMTMHHKVAIEEGLRA